MAMDEQELREYVEVFKTSSDRARTALYVVIVATVLVGIANNNARPGGWPLQRLGTWYGFDLPPSNVGGDGEPALPQKSESARDASAVLPEQIFGGNIEQLRLGRAEYMKQFIGRSVLASSPIPGVSIDINDLALIGGIGLLLLMLVLVICLAREHENLYLALYKVRYLFTQQVTSEEPGGGNGNSEANLLYHALAMRQVVNFPPTLVRWGGKVGIHISGVVFMAPAAVYAWVMHTNWQTEEIARLYGVKIGWLWGAQFFLAAAIALLGVMAWLHSRAMAKRWRAAFFKVNAGLRYLPQMKFPELLKLPFGDRDRRLLRNRVFTALVDSLSVKNLLENSVDVAVEQVDKDQGKISKESRDSLIDRLITEGEAAARSWCATAKCEFIRLARLQLDSGGSQIIVKANGGLKWRVQGKWYFQYLAPLEAVEAEASQGT